VQISIPKYPVICQSRQLELLQASKNPNFKILLKTAYLLSKLDRFEEAVAEYALVPNEEKNWLLLADEARAHIALTGSEHLETADKLLSKAYKIAPHDAAKSQIKTQQSVIQKQLGEHITAKREFLEALQLWPRNSVALRKYAICELDAGHESELLEYCEQLIGRGLRHARLLSTYAISLMKTGRGEEAQALTGYQAFPIKKKLGAISGYPSIEAFNEDLAKEILSHPSLRYENIESASRDSWRVEELLTENTKCVPLLLQQISEFVNESVSALLNQPHPEIFDLFVNSKPQAATIESWSVISKSASYQNWHMHGAGWLSGVYYVKMPTEVAPENGNPGAIDFGWPDRQLGEELASSLPAKTIHPEAGSLFIFPSHLHHRTYPHHVAQDRICVSFDIVPN